MKTPITKRAIINGYKNIIRVGYCDLQKALSCCDPNYYTAGVYGWNTDIYVIDNETAIVTGYRPFGNMELPRDVITALEKCANDIITKMEYDKAIKYLRANLEEIAFGIEYNYDTYNFFNGDSQIEILR